MNKYLIISIVSFTISFVIILHHAYEHREGSQNPLYGTDRYFQLSDVGNLNAFNHEMFVILFFIIGIISIFGVLLKKSI